MTTTKTKRPTIQGVKHSDLFQTCPSALFPLLPYLRGFNRLWEPACGKMKLVNWLREQEGYDVLASDIHCGWDFLEKAPHPDTYDCIITNPPYSIKNQWIERCYDLQKPFALLLPYTALEGQKRQPLYRENGLDLLFLPNRVKFTTPSGKQGGAWFPVAWFTWGILPERIIFAK